MKNQNAINDWKDHPITKELMKKLQSKLNDYTIGLMNGREFISVDPTREIYRTIGIIRLLEEIITLDLLENYKEV